MLAMAYRNGEGSLLYVDALSSDGVWYAVYQRRHTPGHGFHPRERVTSLPIVCSRREAQRHLNAYARQHGLEGLDIQWSR